MAAVSEIKSLLKVIGFSLEEGTESTWIKSYPNHSGYKVKIDTDKETIDFGKHITVNGKTSSNFKASENFVVLECVNRLLEKGYKPKNIHIEKTWATGHGTSGRLDILVTREDGSAYLMIECKTYGAEFDKEFKKVLKDGGQLFTYFQQDKNADILLLYASHLEKNKIVYRNEIVKIEDDYRQTGNVKDFYDRWNKLPKNNGVFDSWVKPYDFQSKALTRKNLKDIKQEDSSFIFNQFLEILRHNVVSDKPNAFNKIFTLFLCKIYDEKEAAENEDSELAFQWFYTPYQYEGKNYLPDDNISFQKRLTDLYKKGMRDFLDKEVTDISDADFERKYGSLDETTKRKILDEFTEIRLKKNNEFAIKEVFDDNSFEENAKVVKEVVELLQGYKIRYTKKQQYLSDFFELLLTTGLKQESGQFFTPVPIAQFIIKSIPLDKIVAEKLEKGEKDNFLPTIIDYAAGSGHFITESMHEVQRIIDQLNPSRFKDTVAKKLKGWKTDHFDWALQYVYGIEKDYRLVKVGKVGCYLHGDGLAQIIHSDGLGNFTKTEEYKGILKKADKAFPTENKQFDIVVSNPPYSVSAFKNNARKYYTEKDFELYDKLTDQSSEIECLFIERTKQLLKDGGIAGIILPSSILSNTGIYTKAREIIFLYFEIIAIAELGSNTFMATGTNTVTLFLRRRNNYDSANIYDLVKKVVIEHKDISINGIEKPLSKYVDHVWSGLSIKDYISILQKQPNSNATNHELYKEYRNKYKGKKDDEFWSYVIDTEREKILCFVLAFNQKVVVVKSGDKNEEKSFLGYEFSFAKGKEGIHPIRRGKKADGSDLTIDDCTQLYDPLVFDNPEKASTYIYQAFQGEFNSKISPALEKNIYRSKLVDLMVFDRAEFSRGISLAVKKKVVTQWTVEKLGKVCDIKIGATPSRDNYAFYDKGKHLWVSIAEMDGQVIYDTKEKISDLGVEKSSVKLVKAGTTLLSFKLSIGKTAIAGKDLYTNEAIAGLEIREEFKELVLDRYLFLIFNQKIIDLEKGGFNAFGKSLNSTFLNEDVKIPLPPKNIQEIIISECSKIDEKDNQIQQKIVSIKHKIQKVIENSSGTLTSLRDITSKIGSGATPLGGEGTYKKSGISLIRSQNVYDNEFYEKGLAFIDEQQAKKLDNVKVEKGDILFNITGASIARCCMVDDKYLPARVNQHVAIIRTNEKAIAKYVQMVLISPRYKSQLLDIGDGATSREAITKSQLEAFKIPLPLKSLQEKAVLEIEILEKEMAALNKNSEKFLIEKQEILKKYL